ncbi:hypothetical protein B0H14DRAFT_2725502 [Mycena olivaceomarginata]|nr:hypothetical protein B0H14DRAFT_2725502 [Mycena olivaceomarginata]
MAHLTHPLRAYAKGYAIFFSIILLLFFAPLFIELYYPAAAPVAAAFVWVTDNLDRAFTAGSLIIVLTTLTMLAGDARRWFARIRARRTPAGPVALEDGVAPPPAPVPTVTSTATATDPAPPPLLSLGSSTFFVARALATHDLVALDRPALENIGAVLLYVLRGCEVLFAAFLGLVVWAWEGEARETQPMQVRVEVEVAVREDIDEKAAVKA